MMYNPGAQFRVTSRYGERIHPITGERKFHRGIDYAAPAGTPVPVAADGVVYRTGSETGWGK